MAILIVDDDANTRVSLRRMLTELGHGIILEAREGAEALRILNAEKGRVQLIVADHEMPGLGGIGLLESIQLLPELDLAHYILTTSDASLSQLKEVQLKYDRLDAYLFKPFRLRSLEFAISQAQIHRNSLRRVVILFDDGIPLPGLNSMPGLADTSDGREFFNLRSIQDLDSVAQAKRDQLEAIILRPNPLLTPWIASFSRTRLGTATPIICASREPGRLFPIRTYCQAFVSESASTSEWKEVLGIFRARRSAGIEIEIQFQKLKVAHHQKSIQAALKAVTSILARDPTNPEALSARGDLFAAQGHTKEALDHYRRALKLQPCQPRPYIRIFDLASHLDPYDVRRIAEEAKRFCPQNQDVLFCAAQAIHILNPSLAEVTAPT